MERVDRQTPPFGHPLGTEPDASPAAWWLDQLEPSKGRHPIPVSALVPSTLPVVCQVLHPWKLPDGQHATWQQMAALHGFADVGDLYENRPVATELDEARELAGTFGSSPKEGGLDEGTVSALVDVLGQATTTPDEVFIAIWEGWGDGSRERFADTARIETPNRGHFLLRGPLHGVLTAVDKSGSRLAAGLWWPSDRAWFVATEIDFEWTFIAGGQELVERHCADDRLEATPVSFDAPANRPSTA